MAQVDGRRGVQDPGHRGFAAVLDLLATLMWALFMVEISQSSWKKRGKQTKNSGLPARQRLLSAGCEAQQELGDLMKAQVLSSAQHLHRDQPERLLKPSKTL